MGYPILKGRGRQLKGELMEGKAMGDTGRILEHWWEAEKPSPGLESLA